MRVDLQLKHPNPNKGWKIVHSVRVIPAGQEMSDEGIRKYASLDPSSRDPHIQARVKSLRGPSRSHRLIFQYLDQDGDDAFIIIPTAIIGDGTKPAIGRDHLERIHANRFLRDIRTGRLR